MRRTIRFLLCASVGLLLACGGGSSGGGSGDGDSGDTGDTDRGTIGSGSSAATDGLDGTDDESTNGQVPPDLPPPIECGPQAGGPYWLLEGETVELTVECETGLLLSGADFELAPLPEGATYDPDTATMRFTPGLDQGATYELTITATPFGEMGSVKIGVADRWDDPDNTPVVDPTIYTEEYGLPVVHLNTSPDLTSEFHTPAEIIYRGHTYVAESKLRGAASLGYPKNSYTLKFPKEDKFSDPNVPGGFIDKRKVVLISTFDDNSYVRQRLAYELWNRLDPEHIQVQVYSGVLFLDGEYYGLYTIADHVNDYLMEDHGLDQAGNLYKARTHDANFRLTDVDGEPKADLHAGLTKEEGMPMAGEPGAYDDLHDLVGFVATSSDEDFFAEIGTRIDRRDYEDWWIFVSLITADDSVGKNSYHYHDPNGGPWRYVPWDFNDSFGQTWQTERKDFDASPESYTWANELFVRFLGEPSVGDPMRARYGEALGGVYALPQVLGLLDAMTEETAASARRDEGRWGAQYTTYGGWSWRDDFLTYEQETAWLRQWIIDRWTFVDQLY